MKVKRRFMVFAALLAALALMCTACGKDTAENNENTTPAPTETVKQADEPAPTKEAEPTAQPTAEPTVAPDAVPSGSDAPEDIDYSAGLEPSHETFTGNGVFPDMTAFAGSWNCKEADTGYIVTEDGTTYIWYSEGGIDYYTHLYTSFDSDYQVTIYYSNGSVKKTFTIKDSENIVDESGTVYGYSPFNGELGAGDPEEYFSFESMVDLAGEWNSMSYDNGYLVTDDGYVYYLYSDGVDWDCEMYAHFTDEGQIVFTDIGSNSDIVFTLVDYNTIIDEDGIYYVRYEDEDSYYAEWKNALGDYDDYDDYDSYEPASQYLEIQWRSEDGSETPELLISVVTPEGAELDGYVWNTADGMICTFDIPYFVNESTLLIMGADLETANGIFNGLYMCVAAAESEYDDPVFMLPKVELDDYYVRSDTGIWYYSIPINWNPISIRSLMDN